MRLYRLQRQAWETLAMAWISAGASVAAGVFASRAWQSGQSGGAALLAGALGALLTILLVAEARRLAVLAAEEERWQPGEPCKAWFTIWFPAAMVCLALVLLLGGGWVLVSVI